MKNAIVLHGIMENKKDYDLLSGSMSNFAWIPMVQWYLTRRGILTQTPEMPEPYFQGMDFEKWEKVISQFEINENTILIGHSCGGGFWLKYLSQNPQIKIGRLILVAPWIDVEGAQPKFFGKWEIDEGLPKRCPQIDLFISSDDGSYILNSFEKISAALGDNIKYHKFNDKGHFAEKIGANFPELLEILK